jgi:hypothetical protein
LGVYVEGVGLVFGIYYAEEEIVTGRWKKIA